MISVTEIFKIGIGPSSSHTLGPMNAARQFIMQLNDSGLLTRITRLTVDLYGSLALTGKGHKTDGAIMLGLAGYQPDTIDIDQIPVFFAAQTVTGKLPLAGGRYEVPFARDEDICFHPAPLPLHENGMRFSVWEGEQRIAEQVYYSIGGGFVVDEAAFDQPEEAVLPVPFAFASAAELLTLCQQQQLSIAEIMVQNELALQPAAELKKHLHAIWSVAQQGIQRGISSDGILPGDYRVARRAPPLYRHLQNKQNPDRDSLNAMDWLNLYALAVSEENAAGGRVVTAPTNGACGVLPAVLSWYNHFIEPINDDILTTWYLTATAIGGLFKRNASISGAEVGCQGEVGVACSMAAAALAALWNGTPEQVCTAAEIAMEHNLGLTCDPLGGQVQVPCIERNAIAAVKAVNAARMALRRISTPRVSLDNVIATMYQTGKDMPAGYRETSQAGLAIVVTVHP